MNAIIVGVATPAAKRDEESVPPWVVVWLVCVPCGVLEEVVVCVPAPGRPWRVTTVDDVSLREMLAVPFQTATLTTKSAVKLSCVKLLGISRVIAFDVASPGDRSIGRPIELLVWYPGGSAGAVRVSLIRVTFPSGGWSELTTKT